MGMVREDLAYDMARHVDSTVHKFEELKNEMKKAVAAGFMQKDIFDDFVAGDFSENSANVTSTDIVGDFSNSWGKYILATPTDLDDTNEASGVWFLDNSNPPAVAGLGLPTLPEGWKYEGWVVLNGTPVSTGTFTDPSSADDNAANSPFKGTSNNGPGYPGEDYLVGSAAGVDFPTDLKGATIVVSVEPYPDNSPAPFALKPLANKVAENAMDHTVLNLETGPVVTLTGSVSR